MEFELSCDDGSLEDLLSVKLLKLYGFYKDQCTFYIPGTSLLSDEEIVQISKYYRVGGHSTSHPADIKRVRNDILQQDLRENKDWLERITNDTITRFCYPRGRHNAEVREVVRLVGYNYARTTLVGYTEKSSNPLQSWTSCHAASRKEYAGKDWLQVAKDLFQEAKEKKQKGYFHFWWHSWEIQKNAEWWKLEEALKYFSENL